MNKITSLKLSKQLAKYGALTAAIVGVNDASGQSIVYNDIEDFTGGIGDSYLIDLDGNGTDDFKIYSVNSSSSSSSSSMTNLYIEPLTASNSVLGSGNAASYAYPFALNNGDPISSSGNSWFNNGYDNGSSSSSSSNGYQSLNYGSCNYGNWCEVTNKYLGLRFNISGETHYGWVRLDVDQNGEVWTVKDLAYHDTPDTALNAGEGTPALSVDPNSLLEGIKIIGLNKTIGLYNLPATTNYKLVNMTGKQIMTGTTTGDSFAIEANNLVTGVYIIELTDVNTNAVIRKKIVL